MDEQEKLALAKRQVAAIKGFYIHLIVFVLVIALLLAINIVTGSGWWVQWVFLGWGIGVLGHAFGVFGHFPGAVARWEHKKVAEIMHRLDEREPVAQQPVRSPTVDPTAAPGGGA
jgi:fatty acid desaturase